MIKYFFVFLVFSFCSSLFATEYYIGFNGNDNNDGSIKSPWRNIAKANSTLIAGDTVFINTGEYQEVLRPNQNGQPGKYITYKSLPDATPVISNVSQYERTAIALENRSYIIIDGIYVDGKKERPNSNLNMWVDLQDAHHCIIRNSNFKYAHGWPGIVLAGNSHHNKILNNRLDWVGALRGESDVNEHGDTIYATEKANYNVIEGNSFFHGGHNLLNVYGSYNVIRNNYFDNDYGGDKGYRSVVLSGKTKGVGYNVFEKNTIVNTKNSYRDPPVFPASMKVEGTNQIVRYNFFYQNVQAAISSVIRFDDVPYTIDNKIYHNVFYSNGGPAWRAEIYSGASFNNNIFKNNIIYKSRKSPKNSNYNADLKINLKNGGDILFNNQIVANSIAMNSPGDAIVNVYGIGRKPLSWYQGSYPSNFSKNIEGLPMFVVSTPTKIDDVQLKSGSPQIDKGDFLTKTLNSGTGSIIKVEDAGYFFDGYGIVEGDKVQVGSNALVGISDVDYSANTLTLAKQISWEAGDGVSLSYYGASPDIGIHEYREGEVVSLPLPPPNFSGTTKQ